MEPAACLRYANEVLGGKGEPGVFVTLFYGILHTDTGMVEFCLGGHNPPYRISRDGRVQPIAEPGGVVIGLLPECCYETGRLQLEPGDSIFLFTDGVTGIHEYGPEIFWRAAPEGVSLGPRRGITPRARARRSPGVKDYTGDAPQADDSPHWRSAGRRKIGIGEIPAGAAPGPGRRSGGETQYEVSGQIARMTRVSVPCTVLRVPSQPRP